MLNIQPRPRKEVTWGKTLKMNTGCGSLYVTINEDEYGLFEVFATMGKAGGCAASQAEAVSRLISLGLRSGIEPEQIIKQLKGVRCPNQAWVMGGRIYSCADAIAKAIERYIHPDAVQEQNEDIHKNIAETNGKGSDTVMVGVCPDVMARWNLNQDARYAVYVVFHDVVSLCIRFILLLILMNS
jgi:ribonucleoside-diphosphate reductase alpha chain